MSLSHRITLFRAPAGALILTLAPLLQVGAQDLRDLLVVCGGGSETQVAWCQETALGLQAAQGALGLAASAGSDLPGSASTLGWRTKGSPRYALSVRGDLTRAPFPSFRRVDGFPRGTTRANLYAVHLSGTVGLFDGLSLGPTVGGFGSLDLTGSAHWVATPSEPGFRGETLGWGVGGRVGVLRESFSLPGITASASYRSLGKSELWDGEPGEPGFGAFDLRMVSLRAMLGKDIGGIGFLVGAGWERYEGDINFTLEDLDTGGPGLEVSGELRSDRRVYFFGASTTFLALQFSGEIGWAQGFDPELPRPDDDGFDPLTGSHFGAVSLRLTF